MRSLQIAANCVLELKTLNAFQPFSLCKWYPEYYQKFSSAIIWLLHWAVSNEKSSFSYFLYSFQNTRYAVTMVSVGRESLGCSRIVSGYFRHEINCYPKRFIWYWLSLRGSGDARTMRWLCITERREYCQYLYTKRCLQSAVSSFLIPWLFRYSNHSYRIKLPKAWEKTWSHHYF